MIYSVSDSAVDRILPKRGFLRSYLQYAVTQTDAPSVFHLGGGLGCLAACLPPEMGYRGPGSQDYLNLYILTIGLSGASRKTKALQIGRNLVREITGGDRVGGGQASHGALLASLREKPCQILYDDDFARFLRESKGDGYMSPVKQSLMSVYDGGEQSRSTLKGGTVEVNSPRLSFYAAVNMTELSEHMDQGDLSSGFFSRFMFFNGHRTKFMPYENIEEQPERWNHVKFTLLRRYKHTPPVSVVFTPEASAIISSWEASHDEMIRTSTDDQEVSLLARIPTNTRKTAALLAVDAFMANFDAMPEAPEYLKQVTHIPVLPEHAISALLLAIEIYQCVRSAHQQLFSTRDMRNRARILSILSTRPQRLGEITQKAHLLVQPTRVFLETLREEGLAEEVMTQEGALWRRTGAVNPAQPVAPALPPEAAKNQPVFTPDAALKTKAKEYKDNFEGMASD